MQIAQCNRCVYRYVSLSGECCKVAAGLITVFGEGMTCSKQTYKDCSNLPFGRGRFSAPCLFGGGLPIGLWAWEKEWD